MLLATCWFLKFCDFVKIWGRNGRLKEATLKKDHFWGNFFSDAHNLGPNRAFWTFSVLSTLVWSLAWWWAQKFLNSDLFCARGGRSKRVPVKPFLPILSVFTPKSSLEKKSCSELNFTPENTPHMSRLHIGNSREGNKWSKNEQF